MPLRDHFRSPVNDKHHWSSFHGGWPMEIVRTLFDRLPPDYQAGPRVYLGSSFEVDVFVVEDDDRTPLNSAEGSGGTATLSATEAPYTVVTDFMGADEYEVRVYDSDREQTLVAAIEIVSPSNKDRPDTRLQLISKVSALLREGVCVSIVDIVSERHANLYGEMLARLGHADPRLGAEPSALYAVTLRKRKPKKAPAVMDAWYFPMAIGEPLPTIPLWLTGRLRIDLPLEPSYQETCRLLRIA